MAPIISIWDLEISYLDLACLNSLWLIHNQPKCAEISEKNLMCWNTQLFFSSQNPLYGNIMTQYENLWSLHAITYIGVDGVYSTCY